MSWTTYLLLPLLLPLLCFYLLPATPTTPAMSNKTITLLIAHPDDEAMFFSPTLLCLAPSNRIQVLCLSTGDAAGLGAVRRTELIASAMTLGVRDSADVVVIDDPRMPDSMGTPWAPEVVAEYLARYAGDADVVLTFDERGVSGHVNHVSLLHGAREFVRGKGVKLWTLTTVGVLRKYSSVLDVRATRAAGGLVFVSNWEGVRTAQRAMTDCHVSQMRWFRWGWIGLSRYMVVNDVREETVV
ncbi:phosphatidylinositol glycan class L [Tricharina praecox]|uniref:phosphatidylinositol glycan class L n=1 Tax=Tricharina praecox TaxID=43433 RepID=UPI00221E8676|nr:phosphatidylinositol glycan class L [Tricharina praecox]KAI5842308.1 phosphatidylinositol glycan class L [Tricharina praecox]